MLNVFSRLLLLRLHHRSTSFFTGAAIAGSRARPTQSVPLSFCSSAGW